MKITVCQGHDSGIKCTLKILWTLSAVIYILEDRDAIQRDSDRLEKRACANLIKFYNRKFKVVHQGQGNPKHGYRLGHEWIDSRPAKMELKVLVD